MRLKKACPSSHEILCDIWLGITRWASTHLECTRWLLCLKFAHVATCWKLPQMLLLLIFRLFWSFKKMTVSCCDPCYSKLCQTSCSQILHSDPKEMESVGSYVREAEREAWQVTAGRKMKTSVWKVLWLLSFSFLGNNCAKILIQKGRIL